MLDVCQRLEGKEKGKGVDKWELPGNIETGKEERINGSKEAWAYLVSLAKKKLESLLPYADHADLRKGKEVFGECGVAGPGIIRGI